MSEPRVSVFMPVYNAATYLPEAVESVLHQTLSSLELIVVDDGSRDDSLSILETYATADSRIHVIANRENKGNAHAHNEGWRRAKSNYVACMHADDIALPDRLERQVQFLDQHPGVAAVGGEAVVIDDTGRRHDLMRVPTSSLEIRAKLPWHNCLIHPTVMMRKEALADVGGYRVDLVEDYDLWLRLSEHYELANLPRPLILHRWHPRDVAYIERQVTGALAVRAAARMRASFGYDLLSGTDDSTADVLSALGVTDQDVRRALERRWVARARTWSSLGKWMRPSNYLTPLLGLRATACTGHFARGSRLNVRRRFSEIGGSPQRHYLCYVPGFMTRATQLSDYNGISTFAQGAGLCAGRPGWRMRRLFSGTLSARFWVTGTGGDDETSAPRATPTRTSFAWETNTMRPSRSGFPGDCRT